jgi:hypothetical protein
MGIAILKRYRPKCAWCLCEILSTTWSRVGPYDLHDGCVGESVVWAIDNAVESEEEEPPTVERDAPFDETFPPVVNGTGPREEPAEEPVPVPLAVETSPDSGPEEIPDTPETPAEEGEPPVPMHQCPDCPEGELLPHTEEHFQRHWTGTLYKVCRVHTGKRGSKSRQQGKAMEAPATEVHAAFTPEAAEIFRPEPVSAPEPEPEPLPAPAGPEPTVEFTGEECLARRMALGVDRSTFGLAANVGPGALELFETKGIKLGPQVMRNIGRALEEMERDGAPEAASKRMDPVTYEKMLARTP